jgi:hypothetical protein
MTRLSIALCSIALAACGSSSNNSTDAAGSDDVGFNKPKMAVHANTEGSDGTYTDVGPADLSCLGTASTDTTTTVAVTLATIVKDFQNQTAIPSAMVTAFAGINVTSPFDTQTADANGNVTVTIPVGTMRFGFDMNATNQFPTLLLNQKVDPSTASQTLDEIQSVSAATAATLSALIGEARVTGTGVVAGAVRDCQAREMSNFVVTVSSTPATATPIVGAQAYYFVNSLPARHNVLDSAGQDALFMVIQLPVAATAYVQAWGYTTDAAVGGDMTLLSQLQAPVLADTVVTGSFEPVRQ